MTPLAIALIYIAYMAHDAFGAFLKAKEPKFMGVSPEIEQVLAAQKQLNDALEDITRIKLMLNIRTFKMEQPKVGGEKK